MTRITRIATIARRHMHEYGTTSEQLAWIKVAASHHAQHNPHAMLREVVTVKEVLDSPVIADPLHRMDCCVVSDGGGALIVARPEIARSLKRPLVKIRGAAEAPKHQMGGKLDLTYSGAAWSGRRPEQQLTQADDPANSAYVENVMWMESQVVFAALNITGSNNDVAPWGTPLPANASQFPSQAEEQAARAQANAAWLQKTFALAKRLVHSRSRNRTSAWTKGRTSPMQCSGLLLPLLPLPVMPLSTLNAPVRQPSGQRLRR